jgi:hypothetical protein
MDLNFLLRYKNEMPPFARNQSAETCIGSTLRTFAG